MISGRRPKRPDGQYYRQARKKQGGSSSRDGDGLSTIALGFVAAAVVGVVVWAIWFR